MEMNKVQCEGCKYIWWDDRSPDMCSNKEAKMFLVETHRIPYCKDINFFHDCPFHKRKWWKFWVKSGK